MRWCCNGNPLNNCGFGAGSDGTDNILRNQAKDHLLVKAVLTYFPKAKITYIRTPQEIANEAFCEALPKVDEEWDPFEED